MSEPTVPKATQIYTSALVPNVELYGDEIGIRTTVMGREITPDIFQR